MSSEERAAELRERAKRVPTGPGVYRWRDAEGGPLTRALADHEYRYVALGSIWPADEAVILEPALAAAVRNGGVGLILVPHEPTPGHLARLEAAVTGAGLVLWALVRFLRQPRRNP